MLYIQIQHFQAKLWDWDTIDDNYLMTAGTPANGPPLIDETGAVIPQTQAAAPLNANNPGSQGAGNFNRPQTAMAVAQNFENTDYGSVVHMYCMPLVMVLCILCHSICTTVLSTVLTTVCDRTR